MEKTMDNSELLQRLKQEDKELLKALKDLSELYQSNPLEAKEIINKLVCTLRNEN